MGGCGSTTVMKVPHEKRFRRAIKLYQVKEVQSLTNLINRNKCFESGESPLTLAAQEGHEAVVQTLIFSGADVNKLDNHGKGPLHIATQLNDEETVEILLRAHANPNKYDNNNTAPLHLATENGNANMVKKLIKAGAHVNDSTKGLTPLIYAVIHKNSDCVLELLRHGADPNVFDSRGDSALHLAVKKSDFASVKHILEYHGDPKLECHDPTSLLVLACLTGCPENVKSLIDVAGYDPSVSKEKEPQPIIAATAVGNADCIDVLLASGADANIPDKRGHTALQMAVYTVADVTKESFYGKYFSNLYHQYSKYDVGEVSQENSTKCVMSLVTGGANVSETWDKFATLFPNPSGITFEQMVTCEVLVQCFGFASICQTSLRTFVGKLLEVREHGLLKLLYSAGVDPTWNDESQIGISVEENDRELYWWIKKLRKNPRTLRDLCRKHIRRSLSWNVLFLVHKLPILSQDMKEYVCIMDTDHYSVNPEEILHGNNNQGAKETPDSQKDTPDSQKDTPDSQKDMPDSQKDKPEEPETDT